MKVLILGFLFLLISNAYAIECDCEIRVYGPVTTSHKIEANTLQLYQLDEYDTYSKKSQWHCRKSCLKKFHSDMSSERLTALLTLYSERLVEEKLVGFNCTGLTTLKYPIRVKASLGNMGLGNVIDQMVVVNHEQECF